MIDREKIIKGLTVHLSNKVPPCDECPYANFEDTRRYNDPSSCSLSMMADALELLKDQETEDTGSCRVFQCKKCGFGIDDIFLNDEEKYQFVPRYCPNCGRLVK